VGVAVRVLRLIVFAGLLLYIAHSVLAALPTIEHSRDFWRFWRSGQAVLQGLDPFAYTLNVNPPAVLPAFVQLARFEPMQALTSWWFLSLALYALTLLMLARAYPVPHVPLLTAWALALEGVGVTLWHGQLYILLGFLALAGWLLLRRDRPIAAGLTIGLLCAIKPNFLLWPTVLYLSGRHRPALSALAVFTSLSLLPVLLYGPTIYTQWLSVVLDGSRAGAGAWHDMSLLAMFARFGAPWLGLALSAGLVFAALAWAWLRRPDLQTASALALIVAVVASPLSWPGYYLAFLWVLYARKRWGYLLTLAAVLLVDPLGLIAAWSNAGGWPQTLAATVHASPLILVLYAVIAERQSLAHASRQNSATV
jgi:hypothetical protein